jgi:hypothetical protein
MEWTLMKQTIAHMKQILGPKATVPEPIIDEDKLLHQQNAYAKKIGALGKEMKKLMLEGENVVLAFMNGLDKYRNTVRSSTFGLDKSDKDDAKRIADAQKYFEGEYARQKKLADAFDQTVDKLMDDMK